MNDKTAVLLVNLGTPNSQKPKDVKKYLLEFLTDPRVIDLPFIQRQLLVRGLIVPRRYKESAKNYSRIWSKDGSPLLLYGQQVKQSLQETLGHKYLVELAMRYQSPSIKNVLKRLQRCPKLIVVPLFPQYASATTGSVHQEVMKYICKWSVITETKFINSYPTQNNMIKAFCARAKTFDLKAYDHILFSFHGLPEKQLVKSDLNNHCLKEKTCCQTLCEKNLLCYSAQCHATADAIADSLNLEKDNYTICFQSRLGKDPWIKPYASNIIEEQAKKGSKKLLVLSPAFVCDCLETIDEIANEYFEEFKELGGETLDLVPGLNNHPSWIQALKDLVVEN